MNVLSLFDGISCGYIAAERAGIKVDNYYAFEIDKHAIAISKKNYPQIIQCGDVTTADFREYYGIDLLIGGSPCQNFSFMGRQNGLVVKNEEITCLEKYLTLKEQGFEFDGQSYLFWEYVRALRECRPKYFLLENVKMAQKWKDIITKEVGVEPILINSSLVSAQNRERLYWTNIPNVTVPNDKEIMLRDVIDVVNREWKLIENQKWCLAYWGNHRKIDKMKKINSPKAGALTTKATHTNGFYCNDDKSALTVFTADEAEILQTLPKGYTRNCGVAEGGRFKAIGNGWTVDVIAHILKGLKECGY